MIFMAMFLAASPVAAADAKPSRVSADLASVERTAEALEPHIDGTWLDGKVGTEALAEAQWQAIQTWAADWLDTHPGASPEALVKAGTGFGDAWSFSAVRLGTGIMLMSASRYQIGTAFILGTNGTGGYRLLWSVAAPQPGLDRVADRALSMWRPHIQNMRCVEDCRMLGTSSVGRLPNAADGSARFWISAGYAQEMGATIGQQLSFWSWHRGRARPLLVRNFAIMVDQAGPTLRGSILHVPSKGHWTSLFACGGCFGRVTDLPFAIGPNRVQVLPSVSSTPEVDLIDRLFARVLAGQEVGAIASPSAIRIVRKQLDDRLAETDPKLKNLAGMIMGWKRWSMHGERRACLNVDGVGTTDFTFNRARTRILSARILDPDACQGNDALM